MHSNENLQEEQEAFDVTARKVAPADFARQAFSALDAKTEKN